MTLQNGQLHIVEEKTKSNHIFFFDPEKNSRLGYDTSKWTVAFHIVEGKTKSNPFFSLIQKKNSRLGYDILSLHNGTKRGERAKWRTCVESKSNSEAFGALVCFNQRSPFILSYFILQAGALFSSLQLKYLHHCPSAME